MALTKITGEGIGTVDSAVVDNITIDGTEIDLSSGDLTLDVAGDIILDADGGDFIFKDGGSGDEANKVIRFSTPSHDTDEENVQILQVESESSSNQISFGGGTSALNSATTMRFLTSSVDTTTGTERLRIDSSGNLGLNTGSSTGRATGKGMEILHVGADTSATLRLTGENGASAESFSEITHAGDVRHMNFKHNGATRLQIDANGGVLVDGGSVGTVSDSRVKKDVEDLSDGLSIVKQLRPVKFKYKGNTEYYNGDDKIYHGFIADEVKNIAPQYITEVTNKIYDDEFDGSNIVDFDEELKDKKFTSVDDFKTMSQSEFIPMLVKAIQEQQAIIEALTDRITALEGE